LGGEGEQSLFSLYIIETASHRRGGDGKRCGCDILGPSSRINKDHNRHRRRGKKKVNSAPHLSLRQGFRSKGRRKKVREKPKRAFLVSRSRGVRWGRKDRKKTRTYHCGNSRRLKKEGSIRKKRSDLTMKKGDGVLTPTQEGGKRAGKSLPLRVYTR